MHETHIRKFYGNIVGQPLRGYPQKLMLAPYGQAIFLAIIIRACAVFSVTIFSVTRRIIRKLGTFFGWICRGKIVDRTHGRAKRKTRQGRIARLYWWCILCNQ